MEEDGVKVNEMKVDGGMTANSTLMQMQSDYLACPIARANMGEATALGAALVEVPMDYSI